DSLDGRGRELIALAQQHGRREIVGEPDGLEVGREEQPAGTQDVVPVGKVQIRAGVVGEDRLCGGGGGLVTCERRQGRERCRTLREPEMLVASPGEVVALTGESAPTPGTAVNGGAPRVEGQRAPVLGTEPAVGGKERLCP